MRYLLWMILIVLFACSSPEQESSRKKKSPANMIITETSSVQTSPLFKFDYIVQKTRCQQLFREHKELRTDITGNKLVSFIADSLLPCWYGTPWDFNGTTQEPQIGKIACGYFVTTVLRDAGFNINRVKMAQCASQQLVNKTCSNISIYSRKPLEHFVDEVKKRGYGLYIVGLDYHTGFILHDGTEVYFIHSGVYEPACALKEKAIDSRTLRNSNYRVLGKIIL
jgi:hypothetical protein